jgi:hypothetical protein
MVEEQNIIVSQTTITIEWTYGDNAPVQIAVQDLECTMGYGAHYNIPMIRPASDHNVETNVATIRFNIEERTAFIHAGPAFHGLTLKAQRFMDNEFQVVENPPMPFCLTGCGLVKLGDYGLRFIVHTEFFLVPRPVTGA